MRKEFKHNLSLIAKIIVISSLVLPLLLILVINNIGFTLFGLSIILWQFTYFITILTSKIILDETGNLTYFRPSILWIKGSSYNINLNNVKSANFILRESKVPVKVRGSAYLMPFSTPSIKFTLLNKEQNIFRMYNFDLGEAEKILSEIGSSFPKIEINNNLNDFEVEDLV